MVEEMTERKYGLLISILSETDLGGELLKERGEPVSFDSVGEAVKAAEAHSKGQTFVKDWLYDIVPTCGYGRAWGKPIESYLSLPTFERIATKKI